MRKTLPATLLAGIIFLCIPITRIIGIVLLAYIAIIIAVFFIGYFNSCYQKISKVPALKLLVDSGLYGEYKTVRAVEGLSDNERILVNVYLPKKQGLSETTEVDVIYINTAGIFVLESKNYSGWIFGNEKDKSWTQVLNKYTKNRFYNPVRQNEGHIKAILGLIGEKYNTSINSIVVFGNNSRLRDLTVSSNDVSVIRLSELRNTVKSKSSVEKLTPSEVNSIADRLQMFSNADRETRQAHIEVIRNNNERNSSYKLKTDNTPTCPVCGEVMVKRIATKGQFKGDEFWGCSMYPKCHGIINIE